MKKIYLLILIVYISCIGKSQSNEVTNALTNTDKEVVCFIYHRFGDSRYPTTNVSPKDFEAHLAYLVKNNFRVLSFSKAIDYLQSEGPAIKTAVITIDDGYKSFYKNGLPLLKKYSLPATLFINTKTVGGDDYMNWVELEAATKSNIEIGNHTHSHDFFLNESATTRYKTFEAEIELSQSIISKHLKLKPQVFSFPYGEFDAEMRNIVKKAGFKAAAAQNSGVIFNGSDFYQCPRFPMSEAYSAVEKFMEKASMHALRIKRKSPDNFILPQDKRPKLTLTIYNSDLQLQNLQCFVQGGECESRVLENNPGEVTIMLQAAKKISGRRRTLYTITVPDKNGGWHWYSHLWIDSEQH